MKHYFLPYFSIKKANYQNLFVILQIVRGEIWTKHTAFAIISRIAKSVGNSKGIRSTEIICDR